MIFITFKNERLLEFILSIITLISVSWRIWSRVID